MRIIITKQALQEGWDCPFAYLLCSLAANSNLSAMTQLVGRILRQPHALKTGVATLDECHVITHQAATADVVAKIKQGLEDDGLGDLVLAVKESDGSPAVKSARKIERRDAFRTVDIFLPQVLWVDGTPRELDYETDILARIDWRGFNAADIAATIPDDYQPAESQLQRIRLTDDASHFGLESVAAIQGGMAFDPSYAVRMISDLVLNPFVGRDIVQSVLDVLAARGFDDAKIGSMGGLIVEQLRLGLDEARTTLAEQLFKDGVKAGSIQFRLRTDGRNWQMPKTMETTLPANAAQLPNSKGGTMEKSLFAPVYADELNKDEQAVAVYLDEAKAMTWWHRNVARTQYGLQGWKRGKVYPDFVFAVQGADKAKRIVALETKGDQLDNLDTAYKRALLETLSDGFAWDNTVEAGSMQLTQNDGATMECALVLMSEWKSKLPELVT